MTGVVCERVEGVAGCVVLALEVPVKMHSLHF